MDLVVSIEVSNGDVPRFLVVARFSLVRVKSDRRREKEKKRERLTSVLLCIAIFCEKEREKERKRERSRRRISQHSDLKKRSTIWLS